MSNYACYDWTVTMFVSGYANTIVMLSQHISQSYFIIEIKNDALCLYNLMQTLERVWSNLKV